MKKTLAALAVLGAFAGSALAADVTLYGLVDYGFSYQHLDADAAGTDATDTFQMKSGQNSGSRFGIKGTEDLGNGLKVSFILENGFSADDGTFSTSGKLFDRQSSIALTGAFGEVAFGRMGQLASSLGSYGLLGAVSPFSTGYGDITGLKFVQAKGHTRYDNVVTYKTPTFSGFTAFAQYSFGNSGTDKNEVEYYEGKASADRYYGIGASYKNGGLYLAGVVDSVNYGSVQTNRPELDDSITVTLGGNYDFNVAQVFASFQYFDNALSVGQKDVTGSKMDTASAKRFQNGAEGYSAALGVGVPVLGGTAKAHVGYVYAEDTEDKDFGKLNRWNIAVGYEYNLSKRTSVYATAAYQQDKFERAGVDDQEPNATEVMAGMVHRF